MTRVLLYELCEAHIVCAHLTQPVQDTGFTGMEKGQILGHLQQATHSDSTPSDCMLEI